jgi:palmitoyltransferase ZDHHC2/15/20
MLFSKNKYFRAVFAVPVVLSYLLILYLFYVYHLGYLWEVVPGYYSMAITFIVYFGNINGLWAYTRCFLNEPGFIPLFFDLLPEGDKEYIEKNDYGPECYSAIVNYCEKCDRDRPVRSHHCVLCDRCVMRMDHHCPWIGNCVGIYNHKLFVQFLAYGFIVSFIVSGCCGGLLLETQGESTWWTYNGCILGLGIGVMKASLCLYHIWLICINSNTIEISMYNHENIFDVGWKENFKQIFGESWIGYIFPTIPNVSGVFFPIKIPKKTGEIVYFHNKVLV